MSASSGILSGIINFFTTITPLGSASVQAIANSVFGGVSTFITYALPHIFETVQVWIANVDLVEWTLFLAITSSDVVLAICRCTAWWGYRLAAGFGIAALNAAVIAISDFNDHNDYPCTTVLQALSQLGD